MPAPLDYREHALVTDPASVANPFTADGAAGLWAVWMTGVALVLAVALLATWRARRLRHAPVAPAPPATPPPVWQPAGYLVLAAIARLVALGQEPADSQELTYYLQVAIPHSLGGTSWSTALEVALSPQMVSPHPPLYRVLLLLWCSLGDSLEALRMPSVIAGALTVPLLHRWLAGTVGRTPAHVAAVALALSPFHVYWSQNATPYTLLGLFVVAAMALHHGALRAGGWRLVAYGAALVGGLLTHFLFPAFLGALALEVAWTLWRSDRTDADRRRAWRFVAAGAWAAVPFALFTLALVFYAQRMPVVMPMIAAMELFPAHAGPAEAVPAFLSGLAIFLTHGVAATLGDPRWMASALPGAALAAWGLGRARGREAWTVTWPLALFALFFLSLGLLTIAGGGFFYFASRRFAAAVPLLYAALALGLTATSGRGRQLAIAALVAVAGLQGARLVTQARAVDRSDLPAAAAWLDARLDDGDAVAVAPYVFFDFLYTWEVRERVPEWYQVGGAARWVPYQRADGTTATVMVSASDLMLPWAQTLEHAFLDRVWLVEVDEAPWDLRELEGPGTIGPEPLLAAGFRPCAEAPFEATRVAVRCFERAAPAPPHAATLAVGVGDYRQTMGLSPPGQVRSSVRRLGAHSGFVLPHPGSAGRAELTIDARALGRSPQLHVVAAVDGQRTETSLALRPGRRDYTLPLKDLDAPAGRPLHLWLSPAAGGWLEPCLRFVRARLDGAPGLCGAIVEEVRVRR